MSKLMGGAVLIGGVVVLGLYAGFGAAPQIESKIGAQAAAALQGSVHGLQARVAGRDITLVGTADGAAEHSRVIAALERVPGQRVVRSEAEVLPQVAPYRLHLSLGEDGPIWQGHLPNAAALTALGDAYPNASLPLGAGAPAGFTEAALAGAEASLAMQSGDVVIEDQTLTLTGLVASPKEVAAVEAALANLPEGYTAVLELDVLDDGKPFALDIEAVNGNATWAGGKLPLAMEPVDLDSAYGAPVAGNIVQARIGEDAQEWVASAEAGMAALANLMEGRLRIEGRTLALTGMAASPKEAAAARAELEGLPGDVSPLIELELFDDGTPYALMIDKSASGIQASGKLPAAMANADLSALEGSDVQIARIGSDEESFTAAARALLTAVAPMKTAQAELGPERLTLTALAPTPTEEAAARAALEDVPEGIPQMVQIALEDDGTPFALSITKPADGSAWQASGKVPSVLEGFDYAAAAGVDSIASGDLAVARIGDEAHGFADAVPPGLAALELMVSGEMILTEQGLTLTGEATDPEAEAAITAVLTDLPAGLTAETALHLMDDGTPPGFTFAYSVAEGGSLSGKLPSGMTPPEIASLAGLDQLGGAPGQSQSDDSGAEAMRSALASVAPWLKSSESLELVLQDGAVQANVTASPGVDGDLLAKALSEALGGDVSVTVASAEAADGTLRTNPATGAEQQLSGGIWLPVVDLDPTVEGCTAATEAALEGERIAFLTGAFRLDAASVRAVNAVAAVALQCAEAGHTLELGGHTDSTGNPESNIALSARRADVVAQALIARGVPASALNPRGYGAEEPIADNESPEGRAANRRTTLRWSE